MNTSSRNITYRAGGFSLVELMIGMVVALIVMLAITASVATINQQRKNTVAGGDAQENAQIALAAIDRSARMAGAGLETLRLLCPTLNHYDANRTPQVVSNGGAFGAASTPVLITPGAAVTDSDRIRFSYSAQTGGITNVQIAKPMPTASSVYTVNSWGSLKVGDIAIVGVPPKSQPNPASPRPCTLFQVTELQPGGGNCTPFTACENIVHNSGSSSPMNPPNPESVFTDAPRYGFENSGAVIGPAFIMNTGVPVIEEFAVLPACNSLVSSLPPAVASCTASPLSFTNAQALAGDIVQMKAQYGLSNSATSSEVVQWVNAPTANLNRVKAVRVAIVARSKEPAPQNATTPCTNAAGVVNVGPCSFQDASAPVINLSTVATPGGISWQRFRYRVYQTVIPLRNLTWNDDL